MKVLKKRQPKKWFLEVTCNGFGHEGVGCKSVLELNKKDLHAMEILPGHTRPSALFYVCPICKRKNNIGTSFWPANIEQILQKEIT